MNAIIIDDEKQIREGLTILLKPYKNITIVGEAATVEEGKQRIESLQPDLVFLDIQLKKSTGFKMLEQLSYRKFKIIFITAYNQYAIKAFKFNAFDYLLKPIDPIELETTLKRLQTEISNFKDQQPLLETNKKLDRLVIKTTEQIYVLKIIDIVRCESDQGYTFFYLKDGLRIVSSKTLKEYASLLPETSFLRVHQSHLINTAFIKNYERSGFLVLHNGKKIPVSVRKRPEVNQRISGL